MTPFSAVIDNIPVMERLQRIPKEGDRFEECGFEFLVSKMVARRVHTVLISVIENRQTQSI